MPDFTRAHRWAHKVRLRGVCFTLPDEVRSTSYAQHSQLLERMFEGLEKRKDEIERMLHEDDTKPGGRA